MDPSFLSHTGRLLLRDFSSIIQAAVAAHVTAPIARARTSGEPRGVSPTWKLRRQVPSDS